MGMPGRGYPYSKLSKTGPSQYELSSRVQFLLFSKAFIALNVFIYKVHYFILFCVFFMVSLRILTLLSQPDSNIAFGDYSFLSF